MARRPSRKSPVKNRLPTPPAPPGSALASLVSRIARSPRQFALFIVEYGSREQRDSATLQFQTELGPTRVPILDFSTTMDGEDLIASLVRAMSGDSKSPPAAILIVGVESFLLGPLGEIRKSASLENWNRRRDELPSLVPCPVVTFLSPLGAHAWSLRARDLDEVVLLRIKLESQSGLPMIAAPQPPLPIWKAPSASSREVLRAELATLEAQDGRSPSTHLDAEGVCRMGELRAELELISGAEAAFARAASMIESEGKPDRAAQVMLRRADMLELMGRSADARAVLDQIKPEAVVSAPTGTKIRLSGSLIGAGLPERALQILAPIALERMPTHDVAAILGFRAQALLQTGRPDDALKTIQAAKGFADASKNAVVRLQIALQSATVQAAAGNHELARATLQDALLQAEDLKDASLTALVLMESASVENLRGDSVEALRLLYRALVECEKTASVQLTATCLLALAGSAQTVGDFEQASKIFHRAWQMLRATDFEVLKAGAGFVYAFDLLRLGKTDESRAVAEEAHAIATRINAPDLIEPLSQLRTLLAPATNEIDVTPESRLRSRG